MFLCFIFSIYHFFQKAVNRKKISYTISMFFNTLLINFVFINFTGPQSKILEPCQFQDSSIGGITKVSAWKPLTFVLKSSVLNLTGFLDPILIHITVNDDLIEKTLIEKLKLLRKPNLVLPDDAFSSIAIISPTSPKKKHLVLTLHKKRFLSVVLS